MPIENYIFLQEQLFSAFGWVARWWLILFIVGSVGFNGNSSPVSVNNLWPVFIIPVGIALGMGLLSKIIGEIRKAF